MQIELIEFYKDDIPCKNADFSGTVHLYLADFDIDLRGVRVKSDKGGFYFTLCNLWKKDNETGRQFFYPAFSFSDITKNKEIFDFLWKTVKPFLIKEYKEHFDQFPKTKTKKKDKKKEKTLKSNQKSGETPLDSDQNKNNSLVDAVDLPEKNTPATRRRQCGTPT